MSWFVWGVLGWTFLSLPLGVMMGRAMSRSNPLSAAADSADWEQIRDDLSGIMPGSGAMVAWQGPSEEQVLSDTAVRARKVA